MALSSTTEPIILKPKIAKCGNHWSVEYNRKGDYYPMGICVRTFEEAVKKAAIVVIKKLNATEL